MKMAFIKRHEISYEKHLNIFVFSKIMVKAIKKLQQLWAAQRMQLSRYAKPL